MASARRDDDRAAEPAATAWPCDACTLLNRVRLRACCACGAPRPAAFEPRAPAAAPAAAPLAAKRKARPEAVPTAPDSGPLAAAVPPPPSCPPPKAARRMGVPRARDADAPHAWDAQRARALAAAAAAAKAPAAAAAQPPRRTRVGRATTDRYARATEPLSRAEELSIQRALANSVKIQSLRPPREGVGAAPSFYPTEAEFRDPAAYIRAVRVAAAPYGICRIVPPAAYRARPPPAAADPADATAAAPQPPASRAAARAAARAEAAFAAALMASAPETPFVPRRMALHALQEGRPFEQYPPLSLAAFRAADARTQAAWAAEHARAHAAADDLHPAADAGEPADGELGHDAYACAAREAFFWRTVCGGEVCAGLGEGDGAILYGSDLCTRKHGSPTDALARLRPPGAPPSPWDLRALAALPGSVLFGGSGISGVTVPWLYYGSLFGAFAWHVEDLSLYSANHLHAGAPKTWYGVPAHAAGAFERATRQLLPALFERAPDLLYELTTLVSPADLAASGTPVFALEQRAGDLVLTLPRAYHAGVSHGFNIAEAVNLAPADWLPDGALAMEAARRARRPPVLAFERLVWELGKRLIGAEPAAGWAREAASHLCAPLERLVKHELGMRAAARAAGVVATVDKTVGDAARLAHAHRRRLLAREAYERGGADAADGAGGAGDDSDDLCDACVVCKHLCYFSAIRCSACSPAGADGLARGSVVCLSHSHEALCACAAARKVLEVRHGAKSLGWMRDEIQKLRDDARAAAPVGEGGP